MHLSDDATKLKLFMDVLDGTKAAVRNLCFSVPCLLLCPALDFMSDRKEPTLSASQLTTPTSVPCLRLGSMMATLLLVLLKQWRRSEVTSPDEKISF